MSEINITEGTASVTSGEITITADSVIQNLTGSSAIILLGSGFGRVVEADGNQLTLAEPWRFDTETDAPFSLYNTIEGLAELMRRLGAIKDAFLDSQEFIDSISDFSRDLLGAEDAEGWRNGLELGSMATRAVGEGDEQHQTNGQNRNEYAAKLGNWNDSNLPNPARTDGGNTFNGIQRIEANSNYPLEVRGGSENTLIMCRNNAGTIIGRVGFNSASQEFRLVNRAATSVSLRINTENGDTRIYGSLQVDGSISESSDARLKDNALTLADEAVLMQVWPSVRAKLFQWKHAIEKKGAQEARWHAGYMVQEIEQAFIDAGIDPEPYALWTREPVYEDVETGEVTQEWRPVTETETYTEERVEMIDGVATLETEEKTREVPVMVQCDLCCPDGEIIMETVRIPTGEEDEEGNAITEEVTRPKVVTIQKQEQVKIPVTERQLVDHSYHLRYSQVLTWETAYLRKRLDILESE